MDILKIAEHKYFGEYSTRILRLSPNPTSVEASNFIKPDNKKFSMTDKLYQFKKGKGLYKIHPNKIANLYVVPLLEEEIETLEKTIAKNFIVKISDFDDMPDKKVMDLIPYIKVRNAPVAEANTTPKNYYDILLQSFVYNEQNVILNYNAINSWNKFVRYSKQLKYTHYCILYLSDSKIK